MELLSARFVISIQVKVIHACTYRLKELASIVRMIKKVAKYVQNYPPLPYSFLYMLICTTNNFEVM